MLTSLSNKSLEVFASAISTTASTSASATSSSLSPSSTMVTPHSARTCDISSNSNINVNRNQHIANGATHHNISFHNIVIDDIGKTASPQPPPLIVTEAHSSSSDCNSSNSSSSSEESSSGSGSSTSSTSSLSQHEDVMTLVAAAQTKVIARPPLMADPSATVAAVAPSDELIYTKGYVTALRERFSRKCFSSSTTATTIVSGGDNTSNSNTGAATAAAVSSSSSSSSSSASSFYCFSPSPSAPLDRQSPHASSPNYSNRTNIQQQQQQQQQQRKRVTSPFISKETAPNTNNITTSKVKTTGAATTANGAYSSRTLGKMFLSQDDLRSSAHRVHERLSLDNNNTKCEANAGYNKNSSSSSSSSWQQQPAIKTKYSATTASCLMASSGGSGGKMKRMDSVPNVDLVDHRYAPSSSSNHPPHTSNGNIQIVKCTYLNEMNESEMPRPNFVSSVKSLFEKRQQQQQQQQQLSSPGVATPATGASTNNTATSSSPSSSSVSNSRQQYQRASSIADLSKTITSQTAVDEKRSSIAIKKANINERTEHLQSIGDTAVKKSPPPAAAVPFANTSANGSPHYHHHHHAPRQYSSSQLNLHALNGIDGKENFNDLVTFAAAAAAASSCAQDDPTATATTNTFPFKERKEVFDKKQEQQQQQQHHQQQQQQQQQQQSKRQRVDTLQAYATKKESTSTVSDSSERSAIAPIEHRADATAVEADSGPANTAPSSGSSSSDENSGDAGGGFMDQMLMMSASQVLLSAQEQHEHHGNGSGSGNGTRKNYSHVKTKTFYGGQVIDDLTTLAAAAAAAAAVGSDSTTTISLHKDGDTMTCLASRYEFIGAGIKLSKSNLLLATDSSSSSSSSSNSRQQQEQRRVYFTEECQTYEYPSFEWLLADMSSSNNDGDDDRKNNDGDDDEEEDEDDDDEDEDSKALDNSNLKLNAASSSNTLLSFTNFKPAWLDAPPLLGSSPSSATSQRRANRTTTTSAATAFAVNTSSIDMTQTHTGDILPSNDSEIKRWSSDMDSNILF